MVRSLEKAGIEPIAISRGKPKGFAGRSYDRLAPTWAMLRMNDSDYDAAYEDILAKNDPEQFVHSLIAGMNEKHPKGVALLCWEKDINECHRKRVGEWLRTAGYEVEEFDPNKQTCEKVQETLF